MITVIIIGTVIGLSVLAITAGLIRIDQRMIRIDEHVCVLIARTYPATHPGGCR